MKGAAPVLTIAVMAMIIAAIAGFAIYSNQSGQKYVSKTLCAFGELGQKICKVVPFEATTFPDGSDVSIEELSALTGASVAELEAQAAGSFPLSGSNSNTNTGRTIQITSTDFNTAVLSNTNRSETYGFGGTADVWENGVYKGTVDLGANADPKTTTTLRQDIDPASVVSYLYRFSTTGGNSIYRTFGNPNGLGTAEDITETSSFGQLEFRVLDDTGSSIMGFTPGFGNPTNTTTAQTVGTGGKLDVTVQMRVANHSTAYGADGLGYVCAMNFTSNIDPETTYFKAGQDLPSYINTKFISDQKEIGSGSNFVAKYFPQLKHSDFERNMGVHIEAKSDANPNETPIVSCWDVQHYISTKDGSVKKDIANDATTPARTTYWSSTRGAGFFEFGIDLD